MGDTQNNLHCFCFFFSFNDVFFLFQQSAAVLLFLLKQNLPLAHSKRQKEKVFLLFFSTSCSQQFY